MNPIIDWRDHVGSRADKFFKTTLWQGDHIMLGLNCLEPGQVQKTHAHDGADKFYFVLEGSGTFVIGNEERPAGAGSLVIAPAGVQHGVTNTANMRLSMLVGIAPGVQS
jgi:mannose-6-phosphate isomerase-like protein (cupin superfamily)